MKAIKKNFLKFTSKLGFGGNRNSNDLLGDQNIIVEQQELPKSNEQDPIELTTDELRDRIESFKSYLLNSTDIDQPILNNLNLPNDLLHTIFISLISNSHMLIDSSQVQDTSFSKHHRRHDTGQMVASLLPFMTGLKCSYLTCTPSTTSEELVAQLFLSNLNTSTTPNQTPNSTKRKSSRMSQTMAIPRTTSNINTPSSTRHPLSTSSHLDNNSSRGSNTPHSLSMHDIFSSKGSEKDNLKMVDVIVIDDIDIAPLPTRYTLLQMMTMRKVAFKGATLKIPDHFNIICSITTPINSMNDNDEDESSLSPLMLDNFILNYRLLEPLSIPPLHFISHDPLLSSRESKFILNPSRIVKLRLHLSNIYVSNDIAQYIRSIVVSLRNHPLVTYGPSPRATPTMTLAAMTLALLTGKKFVTPTHVSIVAKQVLNHRIFLYNPYQGLPNNNSQLRTSRSRTQSISPQPIPFPVSPQLNSKRSNLSKATLLPPPPISITETINNIIIENNEISTSPQISINSQIQDDEIDAFNVINIILKKCIPPI